MTFGLVGVGKEAEEIKAAFSAQLCFFAMFLFQRL